MTGDIAGGDDAIMGMLAAHAVDGRGGHAHAQPELCLNCGTRLIGAHCHACGQSGDVHRTVGAIGHEIAHGVFHFEGRIWRTLPMLVLHPGALTRRYVAGERARFISPLALFLFTVFLMFAVYSWVGPGDLAVSLGGETARTNAGLEYGRVETERALVALRKRRATETGQAAARTDRAIAGQMADLQNLDTVRGLMGWKTSGVPKVDSDWPWLDHAIERARSNPGLVAYKVQSSAYKFSWALILLSTPFVALLFAWRRRFNLYDHAIFTTYSIAFMSLLAIVLELGLSAGVGAGLFWTVVLFAPPVHMFAQLRGAYSLPVFSALWRTAFLLVFSIAVLILFVLALVAMGVSH